MGAIAISIALAAESRAAIVLDDGLWLDTRYNESHLHIHSLLSLSEFLSAKELGFAFVKGPGSHTYSFSQEVYHTPWGNVIPAHFTSVEEALNSVRTSCFTVTLFPTGHCACSKSGSPAYCFEMVPRFFDRARNILGALYARSAAYDANLEYYASGKQNRELVVAWHVRYGDITLYPDRAAWVQLVNSVQLCTSHVKTQDFFFSERPISQEDSIFGFLFEIEGFKFTYVPGLSAADTFKYLSAADMLVHTGSSFVSAAGSVADSSQVFVYSRPKETAALNDAYYWAYFQNENIPAQLNGTFHDDDLARCRLRVTNRLKARPFNWHRDEMH
jgi:hypothetical protein